jgi:hypothetical protein
MVLIFRVLIFSLDPIGPRARSCPLDEQECERLVGGLL